MVRVPFHTHYAIDERRCTTRIFTQGWIARLPHTHLEAVAPVPWGWAQLPTLGDGTWHAGLCGTAALYARSQCQEQEAGHSPLGQEPLLQAECGAGAQFRLAPKDFPPH